MSYLGLQATGGGLGFQAPSLGDSALGLDAPEETSAASPYSFFGSESFGFEGINPGYYTDSREAAKLDGFTARPAGDNRPWYERVAEFGLSRAIDSHYGPQTLPTGSMSGTYAGQNGRTYVNGQQPAGGVSGMGLLLLAGVAALVLA